MSYSDTNSTVRLIAIVDPPLSNECFDHYPDKCFKPGLEVEYVYTLVSGFLKLPIQWIKAESFEEIDRCMDNGTADMIAWSYPVNEKYIEKWGYSSTYLWDNVAMLIKESAVAKSESLLLTGQLTIDLWLTLFFLTIFIVALDWISKKMLSRWFKSFYNRKITCKTWLLSNFFQSELLYLAWFVFISIILNLYSNLVTIDLLISIEIPLLPFSSMDELGDKLMNRECRLALYDVYSNDEDIFSAVIRPTHNSSWAWKFVHAYEVNKPLFVDSRDELARVIMNSTGQCYVGLDWLTIEQYYTSRWCNIKMITFDEPDLLFQYTFYSTRQELRESANTIMVSDAFQGYPRILANEYYYKGYMPNCAENSNTLYTPLNMNKLQDGFYFLLIGLAASLVIIICQQCKKRWRSLKH